MRSSSNESGIALFLVLWVLALLSVIVGEFCHAMRTEVNITRNFKEETQTYYIAKAGLNRAIAELIRNEVIPPKATSPYSEGEEEEEEIRWRINTEIPAVPFGEGQFEVMIENESGKVNINRADMRLLRIMIDGFDLEDSDRDVIVDSILDWRDEDHFHRLNGVEDDYYLSLPEPYECKDDDFDSVEELLLVKGITSKIFYGGLKDIVTVYPFEKKKSSKSKGRGKKSFDYNRININAASATMLLSLPLMTEDLVQEIVEYREEEDIASSSALGSIVGAEVYTAIAPYITFKTCPYYTITSFGTLEGSRTQEGVQALVKIDTGLMNGYGMIQWLEGAGLGPLLK